jgi:hypothetical protein
MTDSEIERKWVRHRFKANGDDYRPVKFPPPGPYWCSGYDCAQSAVLIAYLPAGVSVHDYWPEAHDFSFSEPAEEVVFTDRFRKPEWWTGEGRYLRPDEYTCPPEFRPKEGYEHE